MFVTACVNRTLSDLESVQASSGGGEVCTTFLIEIEPIGDVDVQLSEEDLKSSYSRIKHIIINTI